MGTLTHLKVPKKTEVPCTVPRNVPRERTCFASSYPEHVCFRKNAANLLLLKYFLPKKKLKKRQISCRVLILFGRRCTRCGYLGRNNTRQGLPCRAPSPSTNYPASQDERASPFRVLDTRAPAHITTARETATIRALKRNSSLSTPTRQRRPPPHSDI